MKRDIHFEKMRETSAAVIPMMRNIYTKVALEYPELSRYLDFFVRRRTQEGQCLLRPYLVRLAYEVSDGDNWYNVVPACAAMEMLNISTYQSNVAFDGKDGVVSGPARNNQFISSMISLDLTVEVLVGLRKNFGSDMMTQMISKVHKINSEVYAGQYYGLNTLNISNLDLSMSMDEYLTLYTSRCDKLGGALTRLCFEVGGLLAGAHNELLAILRSLGTTLGTAGQMVNDVSDFIVPQNGKDVKGYENSFSDIKKGEITYPVFYLMKYGSEQQREALRKVIRVEQLDQSTMEELAIALCRSGSIRSAKNLILSYYKKLKKAVRRIPESDARDRLSLSFSSLLTNKYFATLRQYGYLDQKQIVWKGERSV